MATTAFNSASNFFKSETASWNKISGFERAFKQTAHQLVHACTSRYFVINACSWLIKENESQQNEVFEIIKMLTLSPSAEATLHKSP
jgi:hypothetical protein